MMSEQTENLCTTDACESLRARLAKYEDAEGNPISTIAEQARDIESLRLNVAAQVDAHAETRKELAALKAQPSGVVLPERRPEVDGTWGDMGDAYSAGVNDTLDEVARLNSSPVSAGGVDERAAFEAWYLGHFYMGDKQCGLEWLSTEPCGGYRHQHPAEQWKVWQARAALTASAPNHSEQVRDDEDAPFNCEHAACKSLGQHHPLCAGYKRIKAEAAAPSAACQHEWADARNSRVLSGEYCTKCSAIRPGNAATSAGSQKEQGE